MQTSVSSILAVYSHLAWLLTQKCSTRSNRLPVYRSTYHHQHSFTCCMYVKMTRQIDRYLHASLHGCVCVFCVCVQPEPNMHTTYSYTNAIGRGAAEEIHWTVVCARTHRTCSGIVLTSESVGRYFFSAPTQPRLFMSGFQLR